MHKESSTYRYLHSALTHWFSSLVFLMLLAIGSTVWLGTRWTGSNSHCVCVCVLVCVCLRAQTAWSAVPSYRKSRGRPPLVICAGEVEHDPSFPPLYLPPFSFSHLTLSPFMSSASPFVICIWFSYCASLPPRLTSTLPLFSAICPHFFFFPLPLRKMLWKVAVVPYLCQYGAAWPNDWWKTFRAVFVNGTFMSRSKTFLHW